MRTCITIKEIDNTISISGLSAINFQKEIGFFHREKSKKLAALVKKVSGSVVCDKVRVGDQTMIINKRLEDFNSEQLAFIEVKSIEIQHSEGCDPIVINVPIKLHL